jgi:uncharacterized membrane protein
MWVTSNSFVGTYLVMQVNFLIGLHSFRFHLSQKFVGLLTHSNIYLKLFVYWTYMITLNDFILNWNISIWIIDLCWLGIVECNRIGVAHLVI